MATSLTAEQREAFDSLITDEFRVLDRVYYSEQTNTVNFRCWFTVTGFATDQQQRLAILPSGRIVDRNTDTFAALL